MPPINLQHLGASSDATAVLEGSCDPDRAESANGTDARAEKQFFLQLGSKVQLMSGGCWNSQPSHPSALLSAHSARPFGRVARVP